MSIQEIIDRLESPHGDKVYVAKDYTKADLIRDLERLRPISLAELLIRSGVPSGAVLETPVSG